MLYLRSFIPKVPAQGLFDLTTQFLLIRLPHVAFSLAVSRSILPSRETCYLIYQHPQHRFLERLLTGHIVRNRHTHTL